jgi:hypothetical protein
MGKHKRFENEPREFKTGFFGPEKPKAGFSERHGGTSESSADQVF